jgi:hypothetical protein
MKDEDGERRLWCLRLVVGYPGRRREETAAMPALWRKAGDLVRGDER